MDLVPFSLPFDYTILPFGKEYEFVPLQVIYPTCIFEFRVYPFYKLVLHSYEEINCIPIFSERLKNPLIFSYVKDEWSIQTKHTLFIPYIKGKLYTVFFDISTHFYKDLLKTPYTVAYEIQKQIEEDNICYLDRFIEIWSLNKTYLQEALNILIDRGVVFKETPISSTMYYTYLLRAL